jgi:prolyl oligopeptidase
MSRPAIDLKTSRLMLLAGTAALILLSCTARTPEPPLTAVDTVTDTLHGVVIHDEYRWLEDQESPQTRQWIAQQNEYTESFFQYFPGKEKMRQRFSELIQTDKMGAPVERAGRYFFLKREADQEQSIIYMREGYDGEDRMLVDPHPWSEDNTVSVGIWDVSADGKLLAYWKRQGGEDEVEVHFLNVDTGGELPDILERATYSGFDLNADRSGCYYTVFDRTGARSYFHQFGGDFSSDRVLFGGDYGPDKYIASDLSEDGRWLQFSVYYGSSGSKNDVYFMDAGRSGPLRTLVNDIDANFYGQIVDGKMYMQSNWEAPNWRVLIVDLNKPDRDNWKEVIPEGEWPIERISLAAGKLFVEYLENDISHVMTFEPDGTPDGELDLPALGSARPPTGRWATDEAFYSFTSYHIPSTVYHLNVTTGERNIWFRPDIEFDSDAVEVKQVWYESKDGTRIPMFVAHRKELQLNSDNFTYLTGYGGFNSSTTPYFSSSSAFVIENGGVWAEPALRGGGDFGETWHRAAMFEKKQNTFDDFIAAAEWLIENDYTRPEKLAISGGSNGGLLVGAAMTQRPDLFAAVICSYPLLDMLRYHKFLMGPFWTSEYGSADSADQFPYLYAYSPYHNVTEGVEYPAVLFVTGDADTRVDPMHARKMTALMQAESGSDEPILLYYDTKAGHSGGKPMSQYVEDQVVRFGFLFWQLGEQP